MSEPCCDLSQREYRRSRMFMVFSLCLIQRPLWLSCPPPKREVLFVTSYRHLFWQFFSESPSSSSPTMSTAENIKATRMAKQQTKAKITMHFCWDWKERKGEHSKWYCCRVRNPRSDDILKFHEESFEIQLLLPLLEERCSLHKSTQTFLPTFNIAIKSHWIRLESVP